MTRGDDGFGVVDMRGVWTERGVVDFDVPIVLTCGCFDLLHLNHARFFAACQEEARVRSAYFFVAVNSDRSVRRLKGDGRPLQSEADRVGLVASMRDVFGAFVFDDDEPTRLIRTLRPVAFAKGPEYADRAKELPEYAACIGAGAELLFLGPPKDRSSTDLIAAAKKLNRGT